MENRILSQLFRFASFACRGNIKICKFIPCTNSFIRQNMLLTTSIVRRLKEIHKHTDGDVITIEGKYVKSPFEDRLFVEPEIQKEACPLCRINLDIAYTDVLILTQFLREDGQLLPRTVTGLCLRQHKFVTKLVERATAAGLLKGFHPSMVGIKETYASARTPEEQWQTFNVYYDDDKLIQY